MYGRARCLDLLAEKEQSNDRLDKAVWTYRGVVDLADEHPTLVPLQLLRLAAERCIDRMLFAGESLWCLFWASHLDAFEGPLFGG